MMQQKYNNKKENYVGYCSCLFVDVGLLISFANLKI